MTNEDSSNICRTDSRTFGIAIASLQTECHDWSDERLVAGYWRNIDPDEIVEEPNV